MAYTILKLYRNYHKYLQSAIERNRYMEQTASCTSLYGKKLVVIGDSMVQGLSLSDSDNQTWVSKIASRNKMRHKNYGMNGTALSYNDVFDGQCRKEDSTIARYAALDEDADYILVYAGTNDIHNAIPLGEKDSRDITTFYGALHVLCHGLLAKYPDRKIGFITPYSPGYDNQPSRIAPLYIHAMTEICGLYGIPVFDNGKDGGIDWLNPSQAERYTFGDETHLNEAGMEYVSHRYEAFLKSL